MRPRIGAFELRRTALRAATLALPILLAGCVGEASMLRARQRELADPPPAVLATVASMQADVTAWYRDAERAGLAAGQPLDAGQRKLAAAVGVVDPSRVRIVRGLSWPSMKDPTVLRSLRHAYGTLPALPLASTFGYAIYLGPKVANDRPVLAHELTHVAQFERLGMDGFVHEFLLELTLLGRANAPLERAAIANQHLGK